VRSGSESDKKNYKAALGFEQLLVGQLVQTMTGSDVSVNTDHGVVMLTGSVKSQEQSAIASAHAQRQDGVMRVDTHLATAPQ